MKVQVNGRDYEVVKNFRDGIDDVDFDEVVTEYFEDFDYIFGDWAYGKVRLKGFYESTNPKVKRINDIAGLDKYIDEFCAYGCRYFLIKKC